MRLTFYYSRNYGTIIEDTSSGTLAMRKNLVGFKWIVFLGHFLSIYLFE